MRTLVAIELTRLGDFITILPALRALRERFPGARIQILTSAAHARLLALCGSEFEIIGIRNPGSLFGFLGALRSLRRSGPDLVCSMSPSNRNAALALASGAPYIVGYLNGTDSLTPFLGVAPVESIGFFGEAGVTFTSESILDRPWKVLKAIGIDIPPDRLADLPPWTPNARARARLRSLGIKGQYVVIHPFSGWEYRSWPLVDFASLAERILDRMPHDIVFVCHSEEARQLEPLKLSLAKRENALFFPSSDIIDTAALIRDADLFIGSDSGPLHLAALLDVPVVGLFGPASPVHTAPRTARGTFLYKKVSCSPCTQTRCTMPVNSCMKRITVEEVYDAAREYLGPSRTEAVASYG